MLLQPTVALRSRDSSRRRLPRLPGRSLFRLLFLLAIVSSLPASAAVTNYLWDGNGGVGNANWNSLLNWNATNTVPPANALGGLTNTAITFNGVLKLAPAMNNSYFINSLVFGSSAGSFTINSAGANRILTIGSGGITNLSVNKQTIVSSLSLSNSQTWNARAGDLAIRGTVNLGGNILTVAGSRNVAISNVIRGSGAILKQDAGTLTLAGGGANTFSGGTTLNGGNIAVAKANALGTGPLTINAGNLNIAGFNQTVGTVSLLGGSISGTSGQLRGSSFQVQSGTISARLGGTGALIKSGNGTVNLTSPNTYSGGTVINGGTLAVNNVLGSGTGTGRVSINNGGMLMGSGIISGAVTNLAGGTISAGSGVGLFRTGAEFWLGGSTYRWEISDAASTAGVGWDLLSVAGALSISATSGNKAFIDLVSLTSGGGPGLASNFDPTQNYVWTILQTSAGITFAPGQSALTAFDFQTAGFLNPLAGGSLSVGTTNGGRDLALIYTVPEPERWMFLVMGICGYLYGRKWSR